MPRCLALTLVLAALSCGTAAVASTPFQTGKAAFILAIGKEVCRYEVLAVAVLPGEALSLAVVDPGEGSVFEARHAGKLLEPRDGPAWAFETPGDPGLYPVTVTERDSGASITVNVFVMVPLSRVSGGSLNDYRIGDYPAKPLKGLAIYRQPRGLVEVTPENRDVLVSPHFRLGQFLCKQDARWPRYIVMRPRLFLKLEHVLAHVNQAGLRCDTFHVMSGYRTPYYNAAIGNVQYSRHVWGGAADIFIASHEDGQMDDLNGDGRSDLADAAVLYDLIDELYGRSSYERFVGGLGRYRRTPAHGPFVHVDVRGFRARWGD